MYLASLVLLAVVIDLFSREIVGWSTIARQLVHNAPLMAVRRRRPKPTNESSRPVRFYTVNCTRPQLVVRITFGEWTAEDRLRNVSLLGLDLKGPPGKCGGNAQNAISASPVAY